MGTRAFAAGCAFGIAGMLVFNSASLLTPQLTPTLPSMPTPAGAHIHAAASPTASAQSTEWDAVERPISTPGASNILAAAPPTASAQSAEWDAVERTIALAPFVHPQLYACNDPASVKLAADAPTELPEPASQSREDRFLYQQVFKALGPDIVGRTFLEIGALDGLVVSNTLAFERAFDWRGILVEGHPHNSRALRSNAPKRKNAAIFGVGICGLEVVPDSDVSGAPPGAVKRRRYAPGSLTFTKQGQQLGE